VAQSSLTGGRVSDQVFRVLLEALLSGRYAPGEKLPTQRALAADLGVNMTSLREAVGRLEQMGLLEVRQGDAMRVRDWREHGGLDVIAHLALAGGGLDRAVLADVFEARRLMLAELAALAAERRTESEAARLDELAGAIAAARGEAQAQRLDFAFFSELAQAGRNLVFVLILNGIRTLYFEHARLLPVTARHQELAPVYVRAARAIAAGDAGEARDAIADLAAAQQRRVEEALGA
jgi:GntR family transcriptional regulator, transcriptional repressor for pyruvate dehydrogenase complex